MSFALARPAFLSLYSAMWLLSTTWMIWFALPSVDCFHVLSFSCGARSDFVDGQRHPGATTALHVQQEQEQDASLSHANDPIRLNKVFKATHSRRQADALIASGRVKVNGHPVTTKGGIWVEPFVDQISLDDKVVRGWEALNGLTEGTCDDSENKGENNVVFEYIKYWKPRGVTCTTDTRIRGNIVDEITQQSGYRPTHRVFPVGRLDKDTSGLILLTSDGRVPNSFLRRRNKQAKVYNVMVDKALKEQDLERLRNGVVITTVAQRDRKAKPLTAKTKPCLVRHVNARGVQMTLYEGRNRQIRKMMAALNYEVVRLHRVAFGGMRLDPLEGPGDWEYLNDEEMKIVRRMLEESKREGSENEKLTEDYFSDDALREQDSTLG